jgi:FixJ family two-component response regulator
MIAVVDDDASMLKGIERLLGAYGFATKVFASAMAQQTWIASSSTSILVECPELSCGTT